MAFTPRLTAPSASDPKWIMSAYGGFNDCVAGSEGPPSVLPNCTGYVHGRVMEIRNHNTDDSGLSFGNGVTYWTASSAAWTRSQDPSLGAILCYSSVSGLGHVAVVEEVIDNDTVVVSESDYGDPSIGLAGVRFRTLTCIRSNGWRPAGPAWNVTPQGFLKNPYVDDQPSHGPLSTVLLLLLYKMKERRLAHGKRIIRI